MMLVDSLHDAVGGAERFAVGLALALPVSRYDVTVCTTRHAEGSLVEALMAGGVHHLPLNRSTRLDVRPFARLLRVLRRERFDVVHGHKFGSNVWGTVLGRLARVPAIVAHEQTWSYSGQPLRRALDGLLIGRLASVFVAVSELDRRRMCSLERVPEAKTLVIPNAYVARSAAGTLDLRSELGLPAATRLVGTVAVMRPQKALEVLVEAFALLPERFGNTRLVLAGDGPSRAAVNARVRALGVEDRVHFLGARDDVAAILGALDVAAMSSDYEGTPLFAFECMAHGAPLVATRVGGLPDIFAHDGEGAVLVPPRDPEALASAIAGLLDDPARARALAAAARRRLDAFTMERVSGRFCGLYEGLLAGVGMPGAREHA